MADRTGIEWTDATWNPLRGCSRVSEGCRHCYAETVAARFSGPGLPYEGLIHPKTRGWNGKIKLVPEALDQPLRWKRPRRIFVNSMSDLFHEAVPDDFIDSVFAVMALTPQHTFQVLTKRPERMLAYLSDEWRSALVEGAAQALYAARTGEDPSMWLAVHLPLPNVWLGVSVEDQATADERIPLLLQCPAAVRWISAEPLLGHVDLGRFLWSITPDPRGFVPGAVHQANDRGLLHWVVAGGESGHGARPMHPDWARSLRDQCAAAGVPFLFKQWGEWIDGDQPEAARYVATDETSHDWPGGKFSARVGKKAAGRHLDGVLHDQTPQPEVTA